MSSASSEPEVVPKAYVWDDEWLARRTEDALDPDLPIVDPHHHLWAREGMNRYLLDDLHRDTGAGHNVVATVFIECSWDYRTDGPEHLRPLGETAAVAALMVEARAEGSASDEAHAARGASAAHDEPAQIKGIVGFADLTLDAIDEVLEAHLEAGLGGFRGIRHATALDPDPVVRRTHTRPTPGLMGEPSYRHGVQRLAAHDLTMDAWLYHPQIPELTALAQAVPECTIVLDHLGGLLGVGSYQGRRAEILEEWRADMAELARCENVVVKLGGIGMVLYGLGFEHRPDPPSSDDLVDAWGGPITYAIEQFGVDRCMFESNFPVDKMSCSYVTLWNAFKKIAAGASDEERPALFHDTAARVYRL